MSELDVIIEMAEDFELTPLQYMIEALGWDKQEAAEWLEVARH